MGAKKRAKTQMLINIERRAAIRSTRESFEIMANFLKIQIDTLHKTDYNPETATLHDYLDRVQCFTLVKAYAIAAKFIYVTDHDHATCVDDALTFEIGTREREWEKLFGKDQQNWLTPPVSLRHGESLSTGA